MAFTQPCLLRNISSKLFEPQSQRPNSDIHTWITPLHLQVFWSSPDPLRIRFTSSTISLRSEILRKAKSTCNSSWFRTPKKVFQRGYPEHPFTLMTTTPATPRPGILILSILGEALGIHRPNHRHNIRPKPDFHRNLHDVCTLVNHMRSENLNASSSAVTVLRLKFECRIKSSNKTSLFKFDTSSMM